MTLIKTRQFALSFLAILLSIVVSEVAAPTISNFIYPPLLDSASLRVFDNQTTTPSAEYTQLIYLIETTSYFLCFSFLLVYFFVFFKAQVGAGRENFTDVDLDISAPPKISITQAPDVVSTNRIIISDSQETSLTKRFFLDDTAKPVIDITKTQYISEKVKRELREQNGSTQQTDISTTAAKSNKVQYIGNGRYKLDKIIARGGGGVIYKGWDIKLKRPVAAKQLFKNLEDTGSHKARFIEEAQSLAAINHPNIVPIYDLIEENGHWHVMEFLSGGDLNGKLEEHTFFPISEAVPIIHAIAKGLSAAHKRGFIHRDIKPHNVLFGEDGEVKITDFGIAKSALSTVKTTLGVVLGSPAYFSPEQSIGSELDARSDIYSLGVTFYQLITGELPFTGDVMEVVGKHTTQLPEPPIALNPSIGEELNAMVLKCLEKAPADRYQSCLLYTSPSPRDQRGSRMPSSA